jgi:hypothetical protein
VLKNGMSSGAVLADVEKYFSRNAENLNMRLVKCDIHIKKQTLRRTPAELFAYTLLLLHVLIDLSTTDATHCRENSAWHNFAKEVNRTAEKLMFM